MSHKPKVAQLDGMAKLPHPTVPKEAYIEPLITEKISFTKSDMRFWSYRRLKNCSRAYFGGKNNFSEFFWVN